MARSARNAQRVTNHTKGYDMTWDELLRRDDLVGGELETQEGKDIYRGPIKTIRQDGDTVTFFLAWLATMRPRETVWHKSSRDAHVTFNTKDITLRLHGSTRDGELIQLVGGSGMIIPEGDPRRLDPANVRGLVPPPIAQA